MLPLKYQMMAPILGPNSRAIALSSGNQFGPLTEPTHLIERMDRHLSAIEQPEPWKKIHSVNNRPFPIVGAERVEGDDGFKSDLVLKDSFRQNYGIEEKYRKHQINLHHIRGLTDPATRYGRSVARGFERSLIDLYSQLDTEFVNRLTIRPSI